MPTVYVPIQIHTYIHINSFREQSACSNKSSSICGSVGIKEGPIRYSKIINNTDQSYLTPSQAAYVQTDYASISHSKVLPYFISVIEEVLPSANSAIFESFQRVCISYMYYMYVCTMRDESSVVGIKRVNGTLRCR